MPKAKKMEIEALRSAFRDQGNQNIGLPASSKWAPKQPSIAEIKAAIPFAYFVPLGRGEMPSGNVG